MTGSRSQRCDPRGVYPVRHCDTASALLHVCCDAFGVTEGCMRVLEIGGNSFHEGIRW